MTPEARQWVADGRAIALPAELSAGFEQYLERLPWFSSSLDWRRLTARVRINVVETSPAEFARWLETTKIGTHSHVAVWYGARGGGVVIPVQRVTSDNLDELYWKAPGTNYLFGLDETEQGLVPSYGDLLEYGEGDIFTAVAR